MVRSEGVLNERRERCRAGRGLHGSLIVRGRPVRRPASVSPLIARVFDARHLARQLEVEQGLHVSLFDREPIDVALRPLKGVVSEQPLHLMHLGLTP